MARNAEKAMTALARWRRMKEEEEKGPTKKRPYVPESVQDLKECETWRREVIKDISKMVSKIQNPGLGEFKIRDLNDEINRLLRQKYRWEDQVKKLGGPDYFKTAPRMLDRDGKEVPGTRGYKYFGAARDLPGVRELFQPVPQEKGRKTRAELMKYIDADYYGYMDDDDGVLIPLEIEAEKKARAASVAEWREQKLASSGQNETSKNVDARKRRKSAGSDEDDDAIDIYYVQEDAEPDASDAAPSVILDERGEPVLIAPPAVPTQKDVEMALLERKKRELIDRYASDEMLRQREKAAILFSTGPGPTTETCEADKIGTASNGENVDSNNTSGSPMEQS